MDTSQDLTRFQATITKNENRQTSTNLEEQQSTSPSQTIKPSSPNEQLQSKFFSELSVDVRILIYKALVADIGDNLHIATSYASQGKQGKQICQSCIAVPSEHVEFESGYNPWGETHTRCKERADRKMETASQPRTFMPLLLSCKRM